MRSARYDFSLDAPVGQCTVELARTVDGVSVAPYDEESPVNASEQLLAHWRLFTLDVAINPLDMRPTPGQWREEFRGYVLDACYSTDVALTTPVSPVALVGEYVQKLEPLLTALREGLGRCCRRTPA